MPSGLYGSPQLGPFRDDRRRQSAVRRLIGVLTLEPIWKRVVPWSPARGLFRVSTALLWVALIVLAIPFAIRWSASADLSGRGRSLFQADAVPTLTQQEREYVAVVATQQSREIVNEAPAVPETRAGRADVALVTSVCDSQGLPPITTCRGSLRNVSGRSLSGLKVTLAWSATQGGEPQLTASASIDFDPLLPDQTSSWIVVNRYNEALRWYATTVSDDSGHELRVRDERTMAPD